jgi:hypothetical protein
MAIDKVRVEILTDEEKISFWQKVKIFFNKIL